MNLAAFTTIELAQRLDTIEDIGNGKPGEHRAIRLELERRNKFDAERHMALVAMIGAVIDPTDEGMTAKGRRYFETRTISQ
jgi:hypothetical protein